MENKSIKLRIYQYRWLPLLIYIILWGLVHIQLKLNFGDDETYFGTVFGNQPFFEWVWNKYLTYNSRIVTESILMIVLAIGEWLWKIIDILALALIAYCVSEICFGSSVTCRENWLVICIIGMYPFIDMATAGWGATSANYTWPLALGLYVLLNIKRSIEDCEIKIRTFICSILATVIAGNVEQMVCLLLAFTVVAIMYQRVEKKVFSRFLLFEILVIIADFLVILLSPGRSARYIAEISWSYPSYEMLSLVEKITIGITSTMAQFIARTNWIYLFFIILVCYAVNLKGKNIITLFTSYFPLVVYVVLMFFPSIISNIDGSLYKAFYYEAHAKMPDFAPINVMNYTTLIAYLPLITCLLVIGCIMINLYAIFEGKNVLPILIFLSGICTRLLMSFSPSIYESARRTYLFMYYSIIIVFLMVYNQMRSMGCVNKKMDTYIKAASVLPAIDVILNVLSR